MNAKLLARELWHDLLPARQRLVLAVPSKGRLRQPALATLGSAGFRLGSIRGVGAVTHDREGSFDVVFLRAADIPAYAAAGAVDCGITGADLVAESGAELAELVRLGFGKCRLEAAVPDESEARSLDDLTGARIATAFPALAASTLEAARVACEIVPLSGAVEAAVELGVADAIVDLVATGETLRQNRLRSVASLFESEAILVAAPTARPATLRLAERLRAVIPAAADSGDRSLPDRAIAATG
jgi:ATP phosphoribosyltransferase